MKPVAILVASVALAVLASAVTHVMLTPAAEPAPAAAAAPADAGDAEALRELGARVERLSTDLRAISDRMGEERLSDARSPEHDVEAVVRRVLAEELPQLASAPPQNGGPTPAAAAPVTVEALMQELMQPNLSEDAMNAVWERARAAGQVEALVEAFEARAASRPDDPDAQLDAGNACLQMIFDVGDGPAKGMWAARADKAYDRALAIEPTHWEARFTKAMSLSFWPPVFGKQAEAIRQFEVLIEQQRSSPLEPEYARTYELLGNLYQQMGQGEKAVEVWRSGAQLFPGDPSLLQKAGGADGG